MFDPEPTTRTRGISTKLYEAGMMFVDSDADHDGGGIQVSFDADHDGVLDDGEIAHMFASMDTDGDYTLSHSEAEQWLQKVAKDSLKLQASIRRCMQAADKDGNGVVTLEEFMMEMQEERAEFESNKTTLAFLDVEATRVVGMKCKYSPPFVEGLWYVVFMQCISYLANIINACTLWFHDKRVGGAVLMAFVFSSLTSQRMFVPWGNLGEACRSSIDSGVMEPQLSLWFMIPMNSMATYCSLVGPAFTLSIGELPSGSALIASVTLLLNVHAMAKENTQTHLGDQLRQFGEAVVKFECERGESKIKALQVWSHCHMAAEILLTALSAHMCHPLVAVGLFLPASFAEYWVNRYGRMRDCCCWWTMVNFLEPLTLMSFTQSSVFGLPHLVVPSKTIGTRPSEYENVGNRSATPMCIAFALRVCILFGFVRSQCGTECSDLLWDTVLVPFCDFMKHPSVSQLSGSLAYRIFLLFLAVFAVPLHFVVLFAFYCQNPWWRAGSEDEELSKSLVRQATHWVPVVRVLQIQRTKAWDETRTSDSSEEAEMSQDS